MPAQNGLHKKTVSYCSVEVVKNEIWPAVTTKNYSVTFLVGDLYSPSLSNVTRRQIHPMYPCLSIPSWSIITLGTRRTSVELTDHLANRTGGPWKT